jgi:hypothetical protein
LNLVLSAPACGIVYVISYEHILDYANGILEVGMSAAATAVRKALARFGAVNLDNPRYREVLLDGCESLTARLSRVDPELVDATLLDLRKPQTGLSRAIRARLRARPTPMQIAYFILTSAA